MSDTPLIPAQDLTVYSVLEALVSTELHGAK